MEQWTWLVDWLTVGTILLVLWTFIPRGGRAAIVAGVRWVLQGAWEVILISVGRDPSPASTAPAEPRSAYRSSRSARLPPRSARSARSNALNADRAQPDAEHDRVQHSRSAFGVQRDPAPMAVTDPRLPQNAEELQKLAQAILVHARSPRGAKQQGILEAWGVRPGAGPDWARASAMFDLALPSKGRPATAEPAEELQLERAP